MNDIMRQADCGVRGGIGAPRLYEIFTESGKRGKWVTSMSMESMDGVVEGWMIISMGMVWFWYYSLNLISHILCLICFVYSRNGLPVYSCQTRTSRLNASKLLRHCRWRW